MTDRKKRDPLKAGHPRRMTDARGGAARRTRCAWNGMSEEQRVEFIAWIADAGGAYFAQFDPELPEDLA